MLQGNQVPDMVQFQLLWLRGFWVTGQLDTLDMAPDQVFPPI